MEISELARLLDAVAANRCDLHDIESEFRRRVEWQDDPQARAAIWALNYRLIGSRDEDARQTYGPFAPMAELGGIVFPPYLAEVQPDVLEVWERLSNEVRSPAVAARLEDLLWVTRQGDRPHEQALRAIESYVSASRLEECEGLEVADYLDRALELSRELNDRDRLLPIVTRVREALDVELQRDDASSRPGVFVPLLRLLASLPPADRPDDLSPQLTHAHRLLESNHPFVREPLFQVSELLARGQADEPARLRRAKVEMWLEWALKQDGLLRTVELGKALELADNTPEAADLRDAIRRHIQEIDPSTVGMQTVSAKVDLPTEEVEALIERIVGDDTLEHALDRFGSWGPPTGDPAETSRAVDEQMRQFPMQFLVSQVVSHDAGYPIQYLETDEAKRAAALLRHETFQASVHSLFAEEALTRIGRKYSVGRDELRALFETDLIRGEQAEAFARAFEHYWADRWDEAIHVALPRVEAVLRRMLAEAGGIVYKEPRGTRAGGVKTLGEVLHDLRPVLDESWWRFLWVLLTEPLGLNLRNEYLHGLVPESTKRDAALILGAAAYLRLLRLQSGTPATS